MPLVELQVSLTNQLLRLFSAGLLLLVVYTAPTPASTELPVLGEDAIFNIEQERKLGYSFYKKLMDRGLIETHPLLDRYINDLGNRLLAGLGKRVRDYRFFIVRDNSVNAFALPGGFIGINFGLIRQARNQHQLASVLAHEIAHVRLMHGMDMMRQGQSSGNTTLLAILAGLLLGSVDSEVGAAVIYGSVAGSQQKMINFTRENEYEADRMGIELMQDAQFDPAGMVEFFEIIGQLSGSSELGNIEYLRTHPVSNNRVAEAASRIRGLPVNITHDGEFSMFKDYLAYISSDHLTPAGSDFLRALAHIKAGAFDRADALLGDLYRSDNENIWYSIAFAENLEALNKAADAELIYRRLLDIFPGDYVLSLRLLHLLKVGGRYQSALVIARGLENDFPQQQKVYFELSDIYQSLQKPSLQRMAEAEFHRLVGNNRQAIRLYDEIINSADTDLTTASRAREKRLQLSGSTE